MDLDEIPRRIVRDDEKEILEGEWKYHYLGDHRRDPDHGVGNHIAFNTAIVYSAQASDRIISGIAYQINEFSVYPLSVTPVIYESLDTDTEGNKIWEGVEVTHNSDGWYEVSITDEESIAIEEGYYYWIVLNIEPSGSSYIGVDSGPMASYGGFYQLSTDTEWQNNGFNWNWLMEVYVESEPNV
ncbi:MAG: hypothetical protein NUK57_02565 [Gudongella sp.]|nr:hypothetical protein [Gudongella sp.]